MASPLRGYRKKHGLSQQALADRLDVSRPTISAIERGDRAITAEMALLIEARLGIDRLITRPDYFRRRRAA